MNIFVVHGPNLNLLGERPGDERGRTLEELDGQIRSCAAELGLTVKTFQSNHEGEILDALHEHRRWADGIVINPGALTHGSYVLREALAAVNKPAIEVHLTDIRRREAWRRRSVIKDVCASQVLGKGFDSYLIALQRFAEGDLRGTQRGRARRPSTGPRERAPARPVQHPPRARATASVRVGAAEPAKALKAAAAVPVKTIGPKRPNALPAAGVLSRALVRQRIADRLAGRLTASGLATWARAQWQEVQRGAPAEAGQRELLEDALQALVLSTQTASRLSDEQLIDLMAQLDG